MKPVYPSKEWDEKYEQLAEVTHQRLQGIKNMPKEVKDYFDLFIGYAAQSCGSEAYDHQLFRRYDMSLGQLVDLLEEVGEIQDII